MSNKKWQEMPKISEDLVKKYSKYNKLVLQLLHNRNIKDAEKIKRFLENNYEKEINEPGLFNQMDKAIDLIISNVKAKNKILVYGDYDADGVTAAALLVEILEILRARVEVYLPDRVNEGYGLNRSALEKIIASGVKLIITVDGGIRNKEEIEFAQSKGAEVIITDHHTPPEDEKDIPDCLIVNAQIKNEKYPFKYLAGVGASFKLAEALIKRSKLEERTKELILQRSMDLVAIGTVADIVSLTGENRALVKKGLESLNQTKRVGLNKLFEIAGITIGSLNSWNIGFQIAPRLNAAGRIDHANTAYQLLVTKDETEAEKLSQELNQRNIERQNITQEVVQEVEKQVNSEDKIIVGVCQEGGEAIWNEGVIGLVAGRITSRHYRPTLVITKTEDGYKGSGRSIVELNVVEVLEEAQEFLERYGGHPMACGFSLQEENLEKFIEKVKQIAAKKLETVELVPKVFIEAEIDMKEINEDLIESINKFEPFGKDNERPIFSSKNVKVMDVMTMGMEGQHIKIRLKTDDSKPINAIGFNQAKKWHNLETGNNIDIAYYLEINEFNGRREVQMKIVDIKIHST